MSPRKGRTIGAIIRNLILYPHLGPGQVSRSVWKYVKGMAGCEQRWEKEGERAKGWDAQSSALPSASPLWICFPPHPEYQQKKNRQTLFGVFMMLPRKAVGRTLSWWDLKAMPGMTGKGSLAGLVRVLELHRCWWRTAAQDGAGHQPWHGIFHAIIQGVDPAQHPEKMQIATLEFLWW